MVLGPSGAISTRPGPVRLGLARSMVIKQFSVPLPGGSGPLFRPTTCIYTASGAVVYEPNYFPQIALAIGVLTVLVIAPMVPGPERSRCRSAFTMVNTIQNESELQKHLVKLTTK